MKELFIISSYISRLKYLLTTNPMKNVINVANYPLGKENREKPRKLHEKKVYAVIVVEE
ncbi:MAG: hypothetical protein ACP5N5_05390 [Desulfurococcus sp.]|uniref:hypothetical protein n=1 Tax=Desulfurococcus sp. TaxID=51678 RepID=UPI003D0ED32C